MSKSIQLLVKPGDRVKIVLDELNIKFGCNTMYPQGGTGTVKNPETNPKMAQEQQAVLEHDKLALIVLDEEFLRITEVFDEGKFVKKKKILKEMYVPIWLLEREKPAEKPAELDLSALIQRFGLEDDPDDIPYHSDVPDVPYRE